MSGHAVPALAPSELVARAQRVRLVVSDVDGVLTDGGAYYSARGEEMKRFSLRDGMGVERLHEAAVETAFLTREASPIVVARGEKLRLRHVWTGIRDKRAHLATLERETGYRLDEVAYIGDDVNDLDAMRAVSSAGGVTGAPADAFPTVLHAATFVTRAIGGHGAFREFAEWLIALRR